MITLHSVPRGLEPVEDETRQQIFRIFIAAGADIAAR